MTEKRMTLACSVSRELGLEIIEICRQEGCTVSHLVSKGLFYALDSIEKDEVADKIRSGRGLKRVYTNALMP